MLVDVNDIETSDPPRHPAARRHLRGPGRKALAALVLSGVALVIFGRLTLWTLLVIAAAGAIAAAARRVATEEMIAPRPHTGGLSALNPKPWAGPRAGSPRTSGPRRRHYRPGIGSDPARGQA